MSDCYAPQNTHCIRIYVVVKTYIRDVFLSRCWRPFSSTKVDQTGHMLMKMHRTKARIPCRLLHSVCPECADIMLALPEYWVTDTVGWTLWPSYDQSARISLCQFERRPPASSSPASHCYHICYNLMLLSCTSSVQRDQITKSVSRRIPASGPEVGGNCLFDACLARIAWTEYSESQKVVLAKIVCYQRCKAIRTLS